MGIPAD